MQRTVAAAIRREVSLFVRCAITHDVAAAGSANLLPAVDLNGHFIDASITPGVRMTETAEQVLRELVSVRKNFELHDVELVNLPSGPVIVATVSGARPPVPSQISYAENIIRQRLGDATATLLVRATTTTDITAKGRVLLGEARFGTLTPAERTLQQQLESRGKSELEHIANTFVNGIDAAPRGGAWEVRAEVVGARAAAVRCGPGRAHAPGAAGGPVTLSVLNPDGLIVRRDGYSTVQRAAEEVFKRQRAGQGAAGQAEAATLSTGGN
jgi:hypothetical protein